MYVPITIDKCPDRVANIESLYLCTNPTCPLYKQPCDTDTFPNGCPHKDIPVNLAFTGLDKI